MCKPLAIYQFQYRALYHSHMWRHVINLFTMLLGCFLRQETSKGKQQDMFLGEIRKLDFHKATLKFINAYMTLYITSGSNIAQLVEYPPCE